MARQRVKIVPPVCIVSDMADLLDLAGIDAVDRLHLDGLLHGGYAAEALLGYAEAMHRQTGRRIAYRVMIDGFIGGA